MRKIIILTEEQKKQIIELTLQGKTQREISETLNLHGRHIRNVLEENQITRPCKSNSEIIRYKGEGYDDLVNKICKIFTDENYTISEIGDQFNLHYQTISKILHENNIDILNNKKRKNVFNQYYFDVIDTQNKAYFLGFFIADGCVAKSTNSISIDLQARDKHILESFCQELGMPDKHLCFYDRSNKGTQDVFALSFSSQYMKESLLKYGITPCKSLTYQYPDNIPKELFRHLLRGYFDGDGCYTCSSSSRHIFILGTYQFMNYICKYIDENIHVHYNFRPHAKSENTFVIGMSGKKNCFAFLTHIYKDAELYLYRKYNKYIETFNINNSLSA